jgi:hypothetical protein
VSIFGEDAILTDTAKDEEAYTSCMKGGGVLRLIDLLIIEPSGDTVFEAGGRGRWQVEKEILLSRTMNLCVMHGNAIVATRLR